MYPFIYYAEIWDEIDEQKEERSGSTFADTYGEAMSSIESYYGDELISIKLTMLEECPVMEFPEKTTADQIMKASV